MTDDTTRQARPMRILYFGTYRANYARNRVMIEGLRKNGAEVIECQETLWRGIEDRVQLASGGWKHPEFWWRAVRAYARLLWRYARVGRYDVMVVGYPGQFDVFLAWLLTRLHRRPLCWDILMSIYLVAVERKLDRFSTFTVEMLRRIERLACRLPDLLVLDSPVYLRWFCETHQLSPERFCVVPLGTNHDVVETPVIPSNQDIFRVVYFGSFLPSHGVDKMIAAAAEFAGDPAVQFEMIGTGPELDRVRDQAEKMGLSNVIFPGFLDPQTFADHIASADVALGVFGDTAQSMMTVQNKIYECLAMGKALITGESPLILDTFEHGRHMFICPRTPESLAEGIRTLRHDPALRERIARQGNAYFKEHFQVEKIGRQFKDFLEEIVREQQDEDRD